MVRTRRAAVLGAVVALALSTAGCGERARAGTAGDRHDVCTGLDFYDALNEPDPADTDEVVRWADDASAVLRQISFRQRYTDKAGKEHAVPSAVRNDVDTLRAAVDRFRRTVREADGDDPVAALATVRAADRTLYLDAAAREAGRRLQEFAATRCA